MFFVARGADHEYLHNAIENSIWAVVFFITVWSLRLLRV